MIDSAFIQVPCDAVRRDSPRTKAEAQNIFAPEIAKKSNLIAYTNRISGKLSFSKLLAISRNMTSQKHKPDGDQNSLLTDPLSLQPKNSGVSESCIMQVMSGAPESPITKDSDTSGNMQQEENSKEKDKPTMLGRWMTENMMNSTPIARDHVIPEKSDKSLFPVSEDKDNIKNNIETPNPKIIAPGSDNIIVIKNENPDTKNYYTAIGDKAVVNPEKTDHIEKVTKILHDKSHFIDNNTKYYELSFANNTNNEIPNLENSVMIVVPSTVSKEANADNKVIRSIIYGASQGEFEQLPNIMNYHSESETIIKPSLSEKAEQQEKQLTESTESLNDGMQSSKMILAENQIVISRQPIKYYELSSEYYELSSEYYELSSKKSEFFRISDNAIEESQEELMSNSSIIQPNIMNYHYPIQTKNISLVGEPSASIQRDSIASKVAEPASSKFSLQNSELRSEDIEIGSNVLELEYKDTRHIDEPAKYYELSFNNKPNTVYRHEKTDPTGRVIVDSTAREIFTHDATKSKVSQSENGQQVSIESVETSKITPKYYELSLPDTHEKPVIQKLQSSRAVQFAPGELKNSKLDLPEEKSIMINELPDEYYELSSYGSVHSNQQSYIKNPITPGSSMSEGIGYTSSLSEIESKIYTYINSMKLAGQSGYISIRLETKDLGNIKLKVLLKGSNISATLSFDRLETMKTMELQIPDIKRNLEKNQIQVSEFRFFMEDEFAGTDQQNPGLYDENTDGYASYGHGRQRKNDSHEESNNLQVQQALRNSFVADAIVDIFI